MSAATIQRRFLIVVCVCAAVFVGVSVQRAIDNATASLLSGLPVVENVGH